MDTRQGSVVLWVRWNRRKGIKRHQLQTKSSFFIPCEALDDKHRQGCPYIRPIFMAERKRSVIGNYKLDVVITPYITEAAL